MAVPYETLQQWAAQRDAQRKADEANMARRNAKMAQQPQSARRAASGAANMIPGVPVAKAAYRLTPRPRSATPSSNQARRRS